ncbi:hypothetical protein L6452_30961 [Arctium lappa]|uniref:Uncharacterized protein n=1 Tax=Arctium lappa TaxID=4217 RepID=A0ACB8ZKS9_ARCLA|nr:hypothetical protein L6452_30961 [Arctium lappa]
MDSSMDWCKLFPKTDEPSRVYRFPIKDNNHMIKLDSPKFEEQYRIIFIINPAVHREVIPLLTAEELQIARFEKRPSSKTLLLFVQMLSYNTEIKCLSNFRRQPLPPIWNFMLSVLNRTLTWKLGNMDQTTPEILSIMYAFFFNRNIDMAGILYEQIFTTIEKKNKCITKDTEKLTSSFKVLSITFPRFLALIIKVAIDHLHILTYPDQSKAPFYSMNNFKPTILAEGYPGARRIPQHMLKQSISTSEGSGDPEVQSTQRSELEGNPIIKSKVQRDDRALEGAVNKGEVDVPSETSEETNSEEGEDESSEASSEYSQSEMRESPMDLEKPESSNPTSEKDARRHIYFRNPTPTTSAITPSNQPDPEAMVIESEAHTSILTKQTTSEVPISTSEVHKVEETQLLNESSQKDLVNDISTKLPQSMTHIPTHDDASVAHPSPFRFSRRNCPTQGHWLNLQAQGLTCLDRKVNSHIHFQSSESEEEDLELNRTLKDDYPEHRGPSRSPSRDNIKPSLKEGSSGLEDKLATCVVANVPISDILTKSEFERLCEELRGSLKEHKLQGIDGLEASALNSENSKLKAEISTLKTQLLHSNNMIQGLERQLFEQRTVSSLEIVALNAQLSKLRSQYSTIVTLGDVKKEVKDLRTEVVPNQSASLSSEQMASIYELIKSTIQASLPTKAMTSELQPSPPRTAEDM